MTDVTPGSRRGTGHLWPVRPNGGGGTARRYYQSGDNLARGASLTGWVEVCAGTAGDYYAVEKFEPGAPGMQTVRWEGMDHIPVTVPANQRARVRWYQTMPCQETGDLLMWPRIAQTPGDFPDRNILAEGPAFVFHVVDWLGSDCIAEP